MIKEEINNNPQWLSKITDYDCEPEEYLLAIANSLKLGIDSSAAFYSFLVSSMYEINDKEKDFLPLYYEKAKKILVKRAKELNSREDDWIYLNSFFTSFYESFNVFKEWDCIALGCFTASFVAFKCELLDNDSLFEIRDMFVPFGMAISQTKINKEDLYNKYLDYKKRVLDGKTILLPCKLGKVTDIKDIDNKLVYEVFGEIYFDEFANE